MQHYDDHFSLIRFFLDDVRNSRWDISSPWLYVKGRGNGAKLTNYLFASVDTTPTGDPASLYLFEQLCRHLLQAFVSDPHRVEGNQDDTKEAGHGEE